MKFGRAINYTILIEPTDNQGFMVKMGCGNFGFSNKDDLKKAFNEFMDDPDSLEKLYNKEHTGPDVIEGIREDRSGYNGQATLPAIQTSR